ncbi:uncharacterized protein LOC100377834 [Saccoglossus kowalevskii]|uniref:Uncharacterized protein LOC100377834 n=1 Tax=Saccoglossus kowalevskii TaxID=10224 RepID=A0ABM0MJJ8_SACKO|nr:PREDICTED: uncharacterized protein LOC100377834 [Saccoglossus kowalevskii]
MALTSIPFTYSKFPLKILNKGPEFFKAQAEKREQRNRRKTATELLAESRHRYVKSPTFDSCDDTLAQSGHRDVANEYDYRQYELIRCHQTHTDSGGVNCGGNIGHEAMDVNKTADQQKNNTKSKHTAIVKPMPQTKPIHLLKQKTRSPEFHTRDASFDSGVFASPAANNVLSSSVQHTKSHDTRTCMSTEDGQLNANETSRPLTTENRLQIRHCKSKSAPVVNMDYVSKMVSMFNNMGDDEPILSPTEKTTNEEYYSNYVAEENVKTTYQNENDKDENARRPKSPCARRHARRHHTVTCGPRDNSSIKAKPAWRNDLTEPDSENVKRSSIDFSSLRRNSPITVRQNRQMDDEYDYATLPKALEQESFPSYGSLRRDQLSKSQGLPAKEWQHDHIYMHAGRPKSEHYKSTHFGCLKRDSLSKSQNVRGQDGFGETLQNEIRLAHKYSYESEHEHRSFGKHSGNPKSLNFNASKRINTRRSPSTDRKSALESQLLSLLLTEYKIEADGKTTPTSDAGFDSKGDSMKWSSTYHSDKSQGDADVPDIELETDVERHDQPPNYMAVLTSQKNLQPQDGLADLADNSRYNVHCVEERNSSPISSDASSARSRVHRSISDLSQKHSTECFVSELDTFFNAMGMDYSTIWPSCWERKEDIFHMMHGPRDRSSVSGDSHWEDISWRSSRSIKGPFRMGVPDRLPDSSQSLVMKNARIIKWLCECRKARSRSIS